MGRIDLAATIDGIRLPPEIWHWLDLLGDVIRLTDEQAHLCEATFVADTPYKRVLLGGIHSHLSGLKAVYILLRAEFVNQAAGQARLLCEGVITLRYISADRETRATEFLDYAPVEAYEAADALIKWESDRAHTVTVDAMAAVRSRLKEEYDASLPRYQFKDKKGKTRRF